MEKYSIEKTTLVGIGDAIRQKKGITGPIPVTQMKPEIESILVDGIDTSDATASAGDIMKDKTAYVKGQKVTGTKVDPPAVDTAAPTITVSANGLIAAENKQDPGVVEGGTKRTTKQLPTQSAQNITPGTNDVTIPSGFYLTGTQTIKGDANLVPGNIRKNATIFGIPGGYEGIDTSDANAVANDIIQGKTAYVNGNKVTGNMPTFEGREDIGANEHAAWDSQKGGIALAFGVDFRIALEEGALIVQHVSGDKLGDATSADVVKGKTFTSASGMNIIGTFAGGGLPNGVSAIKSGTVTPSEDSTSGLILMHNLGVVPNFCVWFVEQSYSDTVATTAAIAGAVINKATKYTSTSSIAYNIHYVIDGYGSSGQQTTTSGRVSNTTYMTTTNARLVCNASYPIKAGKRIRWVVGVADGVL